MYEVITGERLFVHAGLTTSAEEIYSQPVPVLSRKVPGLPADLDAIMSKSLAISPDARYQTAGEFQEALTRCAHRNGLLMSAPEVASELLELCGPQDQWRGDDDDDDLGYVKRAGTEVYDGVDDEDDEELNEEHPAGVDPRHPGVGSAVGGRAATQDRGGEAARRGRADVDHQHDRSGEPAPRGDGAAAAGRVRERATACASASAGASADRGGAGGDAAGAAPPAGRATAGRGSAYFAPATRVWGTWTGAARACATRAGTARTGAARAWTGWAGAARAWTGWAGAARARATRAARSVRVAGSA